MDSTIQVTENERDRRVKDKLVVSMFILNFLCFNPLIIVHMNFDLLQILQVVMDRT